MPLATKDQIDLLVGTIMEADFHFQIWETLQEAQSTEETIVPIRQYSMFFLSTRLAHFNSTIIGCYRLLETRSDTVNFNTLRKLIHKNHKIDLTLDAEYSRLQSACFATWKKISTLRNKSVGHLSHETHQEELFAKAALSPEELSNYISNSQFLINRITHLLSRSIEAFNLEARASTQNLLTKLRAP